MLIRVSCTKCRFTADLMNGRYAACPKCAQQVTELVVLEDDGLGESTALAHGRMRPNALRHFKSQIAQQLQTLYGSQVAIDPQESRNFVS